MRAVASDTELDDLVWSLIKDSRNPHDFLDYLRHTFNRPARQEEAYAAASECWPNQSAPRLFEESVAALEVLASQGNEIAMFHLGRWYRLGYGVPRDSDRGVEWYRKGAQAGSARCLINLARFTAEDDQQAAILMFERAVEEFGDLSAHCYWADYDKANYDRHLELGSSSGDAFAMFCLAFRRLNDVQEPESASPWLELLQKAADQGESYASVHLARIYLNGSYVCAVDPKAARHWLEKAVALGNQTACATLGSELLGKNDPASLEILKRGAMLGDAYAQSVLGYHLVWQEKSPEQQGEGVSWLRYAAEQGHKPAFSRLAQALEQGRGQELERGESLNWLHKGARLGIADCQTSLGAAYMQGEFVERDEEKAHNLFQLASLQGDAWGAYLLGLTFDAGHGTEKDPRQAFRCFKLAAQRGGLEATFKVGMAYIWADGVEEDIPAGAKWLNKAAEQGHADSQAYLGMLFAYGHGVEANVDIALHWLQLAAKQESAIGLRELAKLYESGDGVEANMHEATRLMAKAASLGDDKAQAWIEKNSLEKPDWLRKLGGLANKELLGGAQNNRDGEQ
jgi:TPR repeat protein